MPYGKSPRQSKLSEAYMHNILVMRPCDATMTHATCQERAPPSSCHSPWTPNNIYHVSFAMAKTLWECDMRQLESATCIVSSHTTTTPEGPGEQDAHKCDRFRSLIPRLCDIILFITDFEDWNLLKIVIFISRTNVRFIFRFFKL